MHAKIASQDGRMRERLTLAAALALVVIATALTMFPGIDEVSIHGDESGWVSAAYHYADLLLAGDFDRDAWRCTPCATWGEMNPPLGKLLIGVPLVAMRDGPEDDHFALYRWELDHDQNVALGTFPAPHVLRRARLVVAAFAIPAMVALFLIGYRAANVYVGLIAVYLVLANGVLAHTFRRTMTDVHFIGLMLGLCLVLTWLVPPEPRTSRRVGLVAALLIGLAASVKIAGLLVGGLTTLAAFALVWHIRWPGNAKVAKYVLVFGLLTAAVVYILNPYLWVDLTAIRPGEVVREAQTLARASEPKPGFNAPELQQDYPQLANLLGPVEYPRLFPRWKKLMDWQANSFGGAWEGSRLVTIHQRLFWTYRAYWFEWVLFLVGIGVAGNRVVRRLARRELDPWAIPLIYLLSNYLLVVCFLSLDWERYYTPTAIASKLVIAYGAYWLAVTAWQYARSRRHG